MKPAGISAPNVELIEETSQIYKDLGGALLLNCTIFNYKDKVILETPSTGVSKVLLERVDQFKTYFGKEVYFTASPTPDLETHPSDTDEPVSSVIKGTLHGRLSPDYIEYPYVVGRSNRFAFNMANRFKRSTEGTILFIYGDSGTGKSHLLHKIADSCLNEGKNVYLTRGNDFVETIKTAYIARSDDRRASSKMKFLSNLKKFHLFVIDDFQYLYQERLLGFISDPLFEVIVQKLEMGQLLAFSSDTPPSYANPHFHERITNRLTSSLVGHLELPDIDMKREYVTNFCSRNEFKITPDIEEYILAITRNLRTVKGILTYCHALYEEKDLRIERLVEITAKVFGTTAAVKKNAEQGIIERVYVILKDYFGVQDTLKIGNGDSDRPSRKPRLIAKIDNIAYYLLRGAVDNHDSLKKYLNIKYHTESYSARKGEELYREVPRAIKEEIGRILEGAKDSTMQQQGGLWER